MSEIFRDGSESKYGVRIFMPIIYCLLKFEHFEICVSVLILNDNLLQKILAAFTANQNTMRIGKGKTRTVTKAKMSAVAGTITQPSQESAPMDVLEPEDQQEIAILAYHVWQERGCPIGSPEEDWFRAEQSLKATQNR
jgi:hypothetical protein